jgi:myo-inositol-1(or 4)-monophosphatase
MTAFIDVAQVRAWALEAGAIALRYFRGSTGRNVEADRKADNTLVTRADREIEAMLASRIRAAYPDHGLIAEEGARMTGSGTAYLWAVDPIDGTRAFVQGLPCWGISIALLHRGEPHLGLFYMPLLDDCTYTDGPDGVFCNEHDLRGAVRAGWDDQSFLAISSSAHYSYDINVRRTRALGSLAANLVYTARGAALGALLGKASIWDIAAGAAILSRAGGQLQYLSGQPVDWTALSDGRRIPEPILAAHPSLLDRLRSSIQQRRRTAGDP